MSTIHAVYQGGVFRPDQPVNLPDKCEVEFEPRIVPCGGGNGSGDAVYAILSERYSSGEKDVAARHDEHQP